MELDGTTLDSPSSRTERISVALCTYNGAKYLQQQLESIAGQVRPPDELILCDDGSSDQTVAIAKSFQARATFDLQIIQNSENLGYSENFSKAIHLCTGDIIALCDQDDIWYPQKLEKIAAVFRSHNEISGVFSDGNLIDTDSKRLPNTLWGSFDFSLKDQRRLNAGHALDVLFRRNVVTGMTFAFRDNWKSALQSMPASWPHDAWLALVIAEKGKLLAYPERLVAYRVHANQQIGVPITLEKKREQLFSGIGTYLGHSRERNLNEYKKNAEQFEELLMMHSQVGFTQLTPEVLWRAQAKAEHARRGATLLGVRRLHRWPEILRRLKSYRYYSSTGLNAVLRDMIL